MWDTEHKSGDLTRMVVRVEIICTILVPEAVIIVAGWFSCSSLFSSAFFLGGAHDGSHAYEAGA